MSGGDDITRTREVTALPTGSRRAHLVITSGAAAGRSVPIDRDVLVLGRSRDADIQIDVVGVSRKHARITRGAGSTLNLVDLGAKNGTWLNGARVDVAALHHGDKIQIADVVLQVVITQDEPAFPEPPAAPPAAPSAASSAAAPAESRLGLSAREWEVAVAVAEGLTNADIAERLGISRRTVATHLERIYERLGIHSRAALAHLVARPG